MSEAQCFGMATMRVESSTCSHGVPFVATCAECEAAAAEHYDPVADAIATLQKIGRETKELTTRSTAQNALRRMGSSL